MFLYLRGSGNTIVDVGCGTGLLGIAGEPMVSNGGRYIGLDVSSENIEFCRSHYPREFEFMLVEASNAMYAPDQSPQPRPWTLGNESADMVTALSVWTHLREEDALFYMKEVRRVLKPGRVAIVTAFVLDDGYEASLEHRSTAVGRYHMTVQDRWVFTEPAYGSSTCFAPAWATVPESAIGITREGFDDLVADAGLELVEFHPGNWREAPGLYFQDVAVLQRTARA
jgi:SAM-dependent methyltransferase